MNECGRLRTERRFERAMEAGIPGGLFSPTLSIGAGVAQWVHAVFRWAPMAAVIALCMTGISRGGHAIAITSFVIVMEMTNGTGMVIPRAAGGASSEFRNARRQCLCKAYAYARGLASR